MALLDEVLRLRTYSRNAVPRSERQSAIQGAQGQEREAQERQVSDYPRIHFPDIPIKDGRIYTPSNGTEMHCFQEGWCFHCKKDIPYQIDPDNHDGCEILGQIYAGIKRKEWVFKDRQPICTAFDDEATPDDPLSPEERAAQLALNLEAA